MVKERGDAILDNLSKINDPQNSELVAYLRKLLNNGIGKENNAENNVGMKNGNKVGGKIPRFTKSDHDALAEIFKKIGQKDLTKQGLQELYNFKQQNPHADLEPFLSKSSDYFRNYIERGLKSIEAETNSHHEGRVLTETSAMDNNAGEANAAAPHLLYLDRLKKLRAQAGLDGSSATTSGIGSSVSSNVYKISASSSSVESYSSRTTHYASSSTDEVETESTSSTLTAASQGSQAAPDVDAIRKRLERIKQSAF